MPGYGDDLATIHASGFTDIAHAAARELLRRLPANARVVDLGCGDGLLLRGPQEVLALLEDLGLGAEALSGGYDGMAFPPGLTAYLASAPRPPRSGARPRRSGRR